MWLSLHFPHHSSKADKGTVGGQTERQRRQKAKDERRCRGRGVAEDVLASYGTERSNFQARGQDGSCSGVENLERGVDGVIGMMNMVRWAFRATSFGSSQSGAQ